jgi:3-mercaptopyruvate sulfurtransferase SseA
VVDAGGRSREERILRTGTHARAQRPVSTKALARDLGDSNLRIIDRTTYLEPPSRGSDVPYIAVPGRMNFEAAHIPGADVFDLQGEFERATTRAGTPI